MKTQLLWVGKTDNPHVAALCDDYAQRLKRLIPFDIVTLAEAKNARTASPDCRKQIEGDALLKRIQPGDRLVLFDERGSTMTSLQYADWLRRTFAGPHRALVFAIGGPYGFSSDVYQRADEQISLSPMTLSHQLVRAFCLEQLYRACAIIHHLPYHHA